MLETSSTPPSPTRTSDLTGIGLALLSAFASGTLALWGKLALVMQLSTATLLGWRFGLTALLLLLLGSFRVSAGERLRLLLLGVLYTGCTLAYFMALARISAGTAALLVYVAPAFVILYGALGGVRPALGQLLALACAVVGLCVVVGLPSASDRDIVGLLLGAAAGAVYGGYLYLSGRIAANSAPLAVTAHVSLVCALTFTGLGAATGTFGIPTAPGHWGLILAMLALPTLVALPALAGAVRRIGAARSSLLATTDPLWALLLATLFLGEELRATQLVGGALILGGAVLAQLAPRRAD